MAKLTEVANRVVLGRSGLTIGIERRILSFRRALESQVGMAKGEVSTKDSRTIWLACVNLGECLRAQEKLRKGKLTDEGAIVQWSDRRCNRAEKVAAWVEKLGLDEPLDITAMLYGRDLERLDDAPGQTLPPPIPTPQTHANANVMGSESALPIQPPGMGEKSA